ncbi:hypothetical protein ACHAQA_000167 [Verticillium albo-atrum]
MASIKGTSLLSCPLTFPNPYSPLKEVLPRWSETNIQHPALIITPQTESDIAAAISIARENGLQLLPAGGGHSTFVSVTPKTLYVNLKDFKSIALLKQAGTVRFGGGVTTGELSKALAAKGYYTTVPDSNAVGMVGALLGGGSTFLNGHHGFMADNVVSFRLVTADGQTREVCNESKDPDERALFYTLCGAGHGLGVVTAATMKAFPVTGLSLTDGKVWTRTLMFPPPALETAIKTFLSMLPAPAPLLAQLLFLRAPPGTPAAGAPLIMVSASYFGPANDAEKAASALLCAEVLERTVHAETKLTPLENLADKMDPLNAHGGFKDNQAIRLGSHNHEAIATSFERWVEVTSKFDDAKRTVVVFSGYGNEKIQEHGRSTEGQASMIGNRERGNMVMTATWCSSPETRSGLLDLVEDVMEVNRRLDGASSQTLPNNMTDRTKLEEMFSREKIDSLKRTKRRWDPEGVFWSPYDRLQS